MVHEWYIQNGGTGQITNFGPNSDLNIRIDSQVKNAGIGGGDF